MHRLWSPSQPTKPLDSASRESIDDPTERVDDTLNTTVEEDVDLENLSSIPPPPIDDPTERVDDTLNTTVDEDVDLENLSPISPPPIDDPTERVDDTLNTTVDEDVDLENLSPISPPPIDDQTERVDEMMNTTVEADVDLENLSPIPPPPIEEEVAWCCICQNDFLKPTMHYCAGNQGRHYRCTECERGYLRTELASGHAFDSIRYMGGKPDAAVVSEPGQLPCPVFLDPCNCASLPWAGLLAHNPDVANVFIQALRRVAEAQVRHETLSEYNYNSSPSTPQGDSTNVLDVHHRVTNALNEASVMRCPSCRFPGLKDEACMHIDCEGPACSTRWCYCCGRHRHRNDNPEDCRGCDASSWHLEHNPGWGDFAVAGEHPGIGARNEFHRRIMRYYIQHIRHETRSELWEAFRRAHPDILTDVPTRLRCISWEEIDSPSARIPPVFGNSTETDLLWILPRLAEDRHVQADSDNEHNEDAQPGGNNERTDNRTNCTLEDLPPISRFWLATCVFTIVLIVVNRVVLDDVSPVLKAVTTLMVAFLVYGVVAFGLLHLADYSALHTCQGERQFCVSSEDGEFPFLSQVGRWSNHRDTYVRLFVGGLALGCWMVGSSDNMASLGGTSHVIGSTMVTLVITNFCCLPLLVNRSRPPQNREDGMVFQRVYLILFMWSIMWAFGIAFSTSRINRFLYALGSVMLSLGLAGLVAEIVPRLLRDDGCHPIWGDNGSWRVTSYLFCVSLALGSTYIWLGNRSDMPALRVIGILLLSIGMPVAIILGRSNFGE
jgi:hypothetical protein